MSTRARSFAAAFRATPLTALICTALLVIISLRGTSDVSASGVIQACMLAYLFALIFTLPVMLAIGGPALWLAATLFKSALLPRALLLVAIGAVGGGAVGHFVSPMTGSYYNDISVFALSGATGALVATRAYHRLEQGTYRA